MNRDVNKEDIPLSIMKEEQRKFETVKSSPETTAVTHTSATTGITPVMGVVVMACNRPTVMRAIDLLLKLVIIQCWLCLHTTCYS